jgi:hypothetical protein
MRLVLNCSACAIVSVALTSQSLMQRCRGHVPAATRDGTWHALAECCGGLYVCVSYPGPCKPPLLPQLGSAVMSMAWHDGLTPATCARPYSCLQPGPCFSCATSTGRQWTCSWGTWLHPLLSRQQSGGHRRLSLLAALCSQLGESNAVWWCVLTWCCLQAVSDALHSKSRSHRI